MTIFLLILGVVVFIVLWFHSLPSEGIDSRDGTLDSKDNERPFFVKSRMRRRRLDLAHKDNVFKTSYRSYKRARKKTFGF